jgi:hypothetical protein
LTKNMLFFCSEEMRILPMMTALLVLITIAFGLVYSSIFEWTAHRYVMHNPHGAWRYAYHSHTRVHHNLFRADESYHLQDGTDPGIIHMLEWAVLIVVGGSLPYMLVAAALYPFVGLSAPLTIAITGFSLTVVYYSFYESLHWCMHLPRQRVIERLEEFGFINGHHLLHHRYMNKNYNVVLPLADWLFGTLLRRAPQPFPQPTAAVPNVQPLVKP